MTPDRAGVSPANGQPLTEVASTRLPELAKALAAAQAKCRAVEKDARNKHHGYDYASADAIIGAATEAMADTGLSVLCRPARLHVLSRGNVAVYQMTREVWLAHASGELLPLGELEWPVIEERGRPLDKAFAIAITTSLAYLLRDLLLMQRVRSDDDMSAQDDRQTAAPQEPNPQAPPAPTPPPQAQTAAPPAPAREPAGGMLTPEQIAYVGEKAKGKGDWCRALLGVFGVQRFSEVGQSWWGLLRLCLDHQVTPQYLSEVCHGKKVAELDDAGLAAATKTLRERFNG
jgi:hypothetical protein